MEDYLRLIRLLLYPFLLLSLSIYVCLYIFSPLNLAFQISLFIGLILTLITFFLEKPDWKKLFNLVFNWRSSLLLVPVIFILITFSFVLSPLIKTTLVDGNPVLGLTALGDYYKHLYVLTSIKTSGLPPHHPFFPPSTLSYYYGYYLIPAAFSSVFNLDLAHVFFAYLLTTTFVVLFVIVQLSMALFNTWYQRLLALTLFVFGTGLDIIPTLIQAKTGVLTANHIEFWSQVLNLSNYLVNNIYTMLLWVPQHCLPSLIVLVTGVMFLKERRPSFFWLALVIWFSVISSTFVSVGLVVWLGLIFLLISKARLRLILSGLVATCLLLPYLTELSGRGSILSFGFYMTPFQYLPFLPQWINYFLTFFTEYGLILVAIPVFFIVRGKENRKEATLITLAVGLPIIIGLFVKSSGFNDFSMRSILPSEMALPFLMAFSLKEVATSIWKKAVFFLLLLSFIPAITGFFYEVHFRLIDRGVINTTTSALLLRLRKNPIPNLAVLDNDDWVFLIPSYGYEGVYSPRLFDSNGYLSDSGLKKQISYANLVNDLFVNETLGKDYLEVVRVRRESLQMMNQFFDSYKSLNFLLPKYRGEKSATNSWFKFMELLGTPGSSVSNDYVVFKGTDISDSLSDKNISLNLSLLRKSDSHKSLYLKKGLWFIVGCSLKDSTVLRLELTDYYTLFDKKVKPNQIICAGNTYYQSNDGNIAISKTSQLDSIYLVPMTIGRNIPRTNNHIESRKLIY